MTQYDIEMLDIVRVTRDVQEPESREGDTGTVVEIFTKGFYLVDFSPGSDGGLDLRVLGSDVLEIDTRKADM